MKDAVAATRWIDSAAPGAAAAVREPVVVEQEDTGMVTRIDHAISEVIAEDGEAPVAESSGDPRFEEAEKARKSLADLERWAMRTRAEGFDD